LPGGAREARQVEREGDHRRRGPVVQLARDPAALLVLGDEEPRGQLMHGDLRVHHHAHVGVGNHDPALLSFAERGHAQDEPPHAVAAVERVGQLHLLVAARDRLADVSCRLAGDRDLRGGGVARGEIARPDPSVRQPEPVLARESPPGRIHEEDPAGAVQQRDLR
jgi:hypothetical protein